MDDPSHTPTNIRQEPSGKVILKLDANDYLTLELVTFENGWFKIKAIESVDFDAIKIPNGEGWIHRSPLGASTRKDIAFLDKLKNGAVVGQIEQESSVRVKEICGNWVKIEQNDTIGWVHKEWLCGNPVTTCP